MPSTTLTAALDGSMERALVLLRPLDELRRAWLSLIGPVARSWLVDRERRAAIAFVSAVVLAGILATAAPLGGIL